MTKQAVERKGFIHHMLHVAQCSSLKGIRIGTQTRQKPGGRSRYRSHGGLLLTDLLSVACSVCFLTESMTTSLGMAPPTVGRALPH